MKLGRRIAATTTLVAGLMMVSVPAIAAVGAGEADTSAAGVTAQQENKAVDDCRQKDDVLGCLQAAERAGTITTRTNVARVVAGEKTAADEAAADKAAAQEAAAPAAAQGIEAPTAGDVIDPGPGTGNGADNGNGLPDPSLPTVVPTEIPTTIPTGGPDPTGGPTIVNPSSDPEPTQTSAPVPTPTVVSTSPTPTPPKPAGTTHTPGKNNGTGDTDGNTSPEGVVPQSGASAVPLNSGCSDAAVCQAAAAPTTATTSTAEGLGNTGAPAQSALLVVGGLSLILLGLVLLGQPRRARTIA